METRIRSHSSSNYYLVHNSSVFPISQIAVPSRYRPISPLPPPPLLYTLYSVKTAAFTSMTYDWKKILPEILYHPCDLLKREREREGEIYIYRFVQIFSEKKFDIIEEKCAIFNLMISFIRKIVSNFQHSFVILVNFKGIVSLLLYTRVYLIHFSISFENIF